MRRALESIAPLLVAAVVLSAALVIGARFATPVRVAGGSMRPALVPGDIVLVSRNEPLRVGRIALMKAGSGLVLHRIIGIKADGSVRTRGDANPVADFTPTARQDVYGTATAVVPAGRLIERVKRVACATLPPQSDSTRQ